MIGPRSAERAFHVEKLPVPQTAWFAPLIRLALFFDYRYRCLGIVLDGFASGA